MGDDSGTEQSYRGLSEVLEKMWLELRGSLRGEGNGKGIIKREKGNAGFGTS